MYASNGRRIGPVSPATTASGASSPRSTCCAMWTKKNCCSPQASSGEKSASEPFAYPVRWVELRADATETVRGVRILPFVVPHVTELVAFAYRGATHAETFTQLLVMQFLSRHELVAQDQILYLVVNAG